ncbi:MAG: hypothetical protein GEU75_05580 [Dehalococcoidia bacterium]|nr:hypothetical protein [Dehalococcoidia bacterium]
MTKGRVIAAAAAAIAFFLIAQTASAQYPEPKGNLVCGVSQANVSVSGNLAFTATLHDGAGNPLSGQTVIFSIVSQSGDAKLSASGVTTNSSGMATVQVSAGQSAGQVVVSATGGEGLECRAISEVLSVVFRPPSTGDAGLADTAKKLDLEDHQLVLGGVFAFLILSSFWIVLRQG